MRVTGTVGLDSRCHHRKVVQYQVASSTDFNARVRRSPYHILRYLYAIRSVYTDGSAIAVMKRAPSDVAALRRVETVSESDGIPRIGGREVPALSTETEFHRIQLQTPGVSEACCGVFSHQQSAAVVVKLQRLVWVLPTWFRGKEGDSHYGGAMHGFGRKTMSPM